jgi:uncharacterized protein (TIGR02466 family)
MQDEFYIEDMAMWDSKLFISHYPGHESEAAELQKALYEIKSQQANKINSEVAVFAKHALFESELNLLTLPYDALQKFRAHVEDLIGTVAHAVNEPFWPEGAQAEVEVVESWYHITQNGGYHDTHSHPNCSWCGIYYLQEGESSIEGRNGVNRFYDPRHGADHYQDAGTAYLSADGFMDFAPLAGQIIIFPSYLKHAAMPYFGDSDRVVLAFNCQVNANV